MPDHKAADHLLKVLQAALKLFFREVHHRILCQGKGAAHAVIVVGRRFLDKNRVDVDDFHPEIRHRISVSQL